MKFTQQKGELYIPDGSDENTALSRVTHMAVGAHQDDIEFMAWGPIRDCYKKADAWFCGVTTTDGAGSARAGKFANVSDAQMVDIRRAEQRQAADIGKYGAQFQLDHPSSHTKQPTHSVIEDYLTIFEKVRPRHVYTHNLADKHDSHVGVVLHLIEALRQFPKDQRPETLTGCEVWRSLDWLEDKDKVVMNQDGLDQVQDDLMTVFESQIEGGKRYDLGTHGRRRANATYFASHAVDDAQGLAWGIDLTPLVKDESLDPAKYIQGFIDRLSADVASRIKKLKGE